MSYTIYNRLSLDGHLCKPISLEPDMLDVCDLDTTVHEYGVEALDQLVRDCLMDDSDCANLPGDTIEQIVSVVVEGLAGHLTVSELQLVCDRCALEMVDIKGRRYCGCTEPTIALGQVWRRRVVPFVEDSQ